MEFHKIRELIMQGKNITEIPLKVTFYARVSTESDEQLNSLENQISYFKDYIASNKNWVYVEGYIDEGISGSTVKKRKKFLKMIDDAKQKKFDLIITKEVSRFSRNLSDSIKYIQELILNNVGVYFQSNGINTYDPNSEFIINMMGSVAQEETKRLSTRVKWGHNEAIKKGRVLGSNNITGYKKENAKLIIVEEEAKIIRKIFELYSTNKYGFTKLAIELHKLGINNSKGKIYDKDTLKRIILNPKYKGFYSGHTTEIIDYRTKKRINIPISERVIYKDSNIPAIVSEELWNKANKILESRSNIVKNKSLSNIRTINKYSYSSKLYCNEHRTTFNRITNKNPKWACSNYIKYRLIACNSPIILEKDLDNIIREVFNKIFNDQKVIMEDLLSYYTNLNITNTYEKEIKKIISKIENIKLKKEKILELNISNNLNDTEFKEKNDNYNKEILELKSKISWLEKETNKININNKNKKNITNFIKECLKFKINTKQLVDIFINKILVSKISNDRNNIKLDIYTKINNIKPITNIKIDSIHRGRKNFKKNTYTCNVYQS